MQSQLLHCVESLLEVGSTCCADIGYDLFVILISIMALHRNENIKTEVSNWLPILRIKAWSVV